MQPHSEISAQIHNHSLLLDGFNLCDPALVGTLKDCNTISRTDAQVFNAAGPCSSGLLLVFGELGLEECSLGGDGAPVVAVLGELADVAAGSNRPQVPILMASLDADVQIHGSFLTQPRHFSDSVPFFVGILFFGLPFGTACDLALGHAHPSEDLVHWCGWVLFDLKVSIKKASNRHSQPTRSRNSQLPGGPGGWKYFSRLAIVAWQLAQAGPPGCRKAASFDQGITGHRQCLLGALAPALFFGITDQIQKQEASIMPTFLYPAGIIRTSCHLPCNRLPKNEADGLTEGNLRMQSGNCCAFPRPG